MLFSELITQIPESIPIKIIRSSQRFDLSNVALLDGQQSEYTNTILYFGYSKQVNPHTVPPQCVLAAEDGESVRAGDFLSLALVKPEFLFALFNAVRTALDTSRTPGLAGELSAFLARNQSVDSLINFSASKLGNSLVLLDSDFKILAHSTIFPIEDPLWTQNIRQGYCSYEFVSAVAELDTVKNASPTPDPVVVICSASPLRKLSSKIFRNGQRLGILLMLERETPISSAHFQMLPVMGAAMAEALALYAPYLLPGSTAYQKLLYDLLIGASPEEIAPRLAGLSFSPHLCALCVQPARHLGQQYLKEHVAKRLTAMLPGTRYTFHENGIAALVALDESPDLSAEQLAALESFAREDFLKIGVSNAFFRVETFSRRYAQARRALALLPCLGPDSPVCRYADCTFFDLLGSAKGVAPLGLFCHPALTLLNQYDHDNGTDLYHTLEAYLACDCNIKLTAERLFIHRNTLTYRLERIRTLSQADLSDSNIRFLLGMSYRIDHFIGQDS